MLQLLQEKVQAQPELHPSVTGPASEAEVEEEIHCDTHELQ